MGSRAGRAGRFATGSSTSGEVRYGIEHEIALVRPDGRFADFANTGFGEFQAMVDALPFNASDYPGLRVGDLGIKVKRWYVEATSASAHMVSL